MESGGWLGVAAIAVTSLFAWLNKRDALRHDTELAALKAQNTQQAGQIATVTKSQERCEEEHRSTSTKLGKCEEKHETTEVRIAEIEAKLAQKKDATRPHEPLT